MEKAIDRQRVLLRHLSPAASAAPPAISVRIPSLTPPLSRSLRPNRACWSDRFGGVISGPRSVTDGRGCCMCGCVAGERVRGGGQRGVPPDAGLRRRRRHRRVSGIRLPAFFVCFDLIGSGGVFFC
jgi:hypothetical protein